MPVSDCSLFQRGMNVVKQLRDSAAAEEGPSKVLPEMQRLQVDMSHACEMCGAGLARQIKRLELSPTPSMMLIEADALEHGMRKDPNFTRCMENPKLNLSKSECVGCLVPLTRNSGGSPGMKLFSSKKPLSSPPSHNPNNRDFRMKFAGYETVSVTGFEFLGKVLERGFVEVDKVSNLQVKPPHRRPSTWLNVGVGIAGLLVGGFGVLESNPVGPINLGLIALGGHHLTKTVDYVEEYAGIPVSQTSAGWVQSGQVTPGTRTLPPTPSYPPRRVKILA